MGPLLCQQGVKICTNKTDTTVCYCNSLFYGVWAVYSKSSMPLWVCQCFSYEPVKACYTLREYPTRTCGGTCQNVKQT